VTNASSQKTAIVVRILTRGSAGSSKPVRSTGIVFVLPDGKPKLGTSWARIVSNPGSPGPALPLEPEEEQGPEGQELEEWLAKDGPHRGRSVAGDRTFQ